MESLKNKIEDLKKEQSRILRGFGGRYSYRSRIDPKNKENVKRSNKRIKKAKLRLIAIGGEIKDLERELEREKLKNISSSELFSSAFSESIKLFD
jgi:transposase